MHSAMVNKRESVLYSESCNKEYTHIVADDTSLGALQPSKASTENLLGIRTAAHLHSFAGGQLTQELLLTRLKRRVGGI